jgi:predicted RNase H-like HicB family nuclease
MAILRGKASKNVSKGYIRDIRPAKPATIPVRLDETAQASVYFRKYGRGELGMSLYHVTAEWDDEAQVWVASSEDVPGLATGADTFEALIEKLKVVIPELLVENGLLPAGTEGVPFEIRAERTEYAHVA